MTGAEELAARRRLRERIIDVMDARDMDFRALAVAADCSVQLLKNVLYNTDGNTHPRIAKRILAAVGVRDETEARFLIARSRWDEVAKRRTRKPTGTWHLVDWDRLAAIMRHQHTTALETSIMMGKGKKFISDHKFHNMPITTQDAEKIADLLHSSPEEFLKEETA